MKHTKWKMRRKSDLKLCMNFKFRKLNQKRKGRIGIDKSIQVKQMESFKITAKEFLLLCTATDADEVYGVDDAYENLTEDNVEKEVRNAQKSLEEKNYIQSDFDGNSEIRDDLMELISCCVECNNVISVDHAQGNKGQTNVVYYIQDEKVVKSEKKDDIYIIGWLKKEMLYSDIKGFS